MVNATMVRLDLLTEGFARLVGSHDVAFELLERYVKPKAYNPWNEQEGIKARNIWRTNSNKPLEPIRRYRNHLLHGRLTPGFYANDFYFPKMGKETNYLDWRLITDLNAIGANPKDFDTGRNILSSARLETLEYLETTWKKYLL
jgi:hypothetical protein